MCSLQRWDYSRTLSRLGVSYSPMVFGRMIVSSQLLLFVSFHPNPSPACSSATSPETPLLVHVKRLMLPAQDPR